MSKRRSTREQRCINCKINMRWCYCNKVKKKNIQTFVTLIMHHRERFLTSNTANLTLRLLEQSEIILRGKREECNKSQVQAKQEKLVKSNHIPLYLFPHEDSLLLDKATISQFKGPIQLIVPDGSWRQAKKVYRRTPELEQVQTVRLPNLDVRSEYKLRAQTKTGMLCTIEAVAYALSIIEGEHVFEHLMQAFRIMNERVHLSRNLHLYHKTL